MAKEKILVVDDEKAIKQAGLLLSDRKVTGSARSLLILEKKRWIC